MARIKQAIIQRDFRMLEVREDLLERDDMEVRQISLKTARNVRSRFTGALDARAGSVFYRTLPASALAPIEITPADGLTYALILHDNGLMVINDRASVVYEETVAPWSKAADLWVQPLRETTLIGDSATGIRKLVYSGGSWSFAPWSFDESFGGELAQPYWVFNKGVTLRPSARSGQITVTASSPVFKAGYVGLRLRYGQREIAINGYVSPTVLQGEVVTELPPSFDVTVEDGSEFRVGESVVGQDTNYQGQIVAISGNVLSVVTLAYFDGPEVDEKLVGPNASSKVTGVDEIDPLASVVWDEPMMSAVRGWPRAAASASGRLILLDFPQIPDGIAVSSARSRFDFRVGIEDDDAIARQIGDDAPRFLHAVAIGDLLLFSDRGCYLVNLRDNGVLTPSTFNAVIYDRRGCSSIAPVQVNDGVVFVEANGQTVSAAVLSGNVYLKWTVLPITEMHNHLVRSPVALCGPSLTTAEPEKLVFIINSDGTMVAISYTANLQESVIGASLWTTSGSYIAASPAFSSYWAVVDREVAAGTVRMLEAFDEDVYVDSAAVYETPGAIAPFRVNGIELLVNGDRLHVGAPHLTHLAGREVELLDHDGGFYRQAPMTVNADGTITEEPFVLGERQAGLNYVSEAAQWPVEVIESRRVGTFTARCIRFLLSVQDTLEFQARCNGTTRTIGGYDFGNDLGAASPLRTTKKAIPVFGRREHADLAVIKHKPGPFRVLYLGQEVQA